MKGLTSLVIITAGLLAGCTGGNVNPTVPTTPAATAPAPSATPKASGLTGADLAYLERLRKEQPDVYTGCEGQGSETSIRDVKPNLQIVGLITFVSRATPEHPFGIVRHTYDGTKITVVDAGKAGINVTWSNTSKHLKLYSFITGTPSFGTWTQSLQKHRGGYNEANINPSSLEMKANANTAETWYITAQNTDPDPQAKCKGRESQLYREINWAKLFETSRLDSDNSFA